MKRSFIFSFVVGFVVLMLAGAVYYQRSALVGYIGDVETLRDIVKNSVSEEVSTKAVTIVQEALVDVPLRGPTTPISEIKLSSAGVLNWTNIKRTESGLPPLVVQPRLSASAVLKVQDMFTQQYFAHNSPEGTGVSDLAERTGYEYILVGENLALGNYKSDQDLVQAWMDSPGHRANILHERFTEIGIALMEGTFEGNTVWLAVQEFGLPLSECPSPDKDLALKIDQNKEELSIQNSQLAALQEELEDSESKHGSSYNHMVREYNDAVEIYNSLVKETKKLVEEYNIQVGEFNTCASG